MKKITFLSTLLVIVLLLASCVDEGVNKQSLQATSGDNTGDASFMRVHFINVGQADATLLQIKENDDIITMLIDTGDWNRSDVVSYLHNENIESIDLIAITHPHADHIGQLDKIIETFDVGEVWMNGETSNAQVFANALTAIEKYNVDYYEPTTGDVFDIGPLTIEILHPSDLSLGVNDNSISMRATYGDINFLFTGDAERAGEEKMIASGANLKADILHLGHHGSNTSSTGHFLEAVNAETAIYSAGANNSYGHPDAEIIERVKARNMNVYGTDTEGTIVIDTNGQTYHVTTETKETLPSPLLKKVCLNINTSSADELQKIKHIGEKLADEIIQGRPYNSLDDLLNIKGIGDSRLNDIKEQNLACIGG